MWLDLGVNWDGVCGGEKMRRSSVFFCRYHLWSVTRCAWDDLAFFGYSTCFGSVGTRGREFFWDGRGEEALSLEYERHDTKDFDDERSITSIYVIASKLQSY